MSFFIASASCQAASAALRADGSLFSCEKRQGQEKAQLYRALANAEQ
jgi:hypothetical protein